MCLIQFIQPGLFYIISHCKYSGVCLFIKKMIKEQNQCKKRSFRMLFNLNSLIDKFTKSSETCNEYDEHIQVGFTL